jgi:hypothetical protein
VLVVEGEDDYYFIKSLLDNCAKGIWESAWVVGEAEGKDNVMSILAREPSWFGLIDRDEWTLADATAAQGNFPGRLYILPRYCMESYFVVPSELWTLLDDRQRVQLNNDVVAFSDALTKELEQWLRHGVLWHSINPLWRGLQSVGFQKELLEVENAQRTDAEIEATLIRWHDYLKPADIMARFSTDLAAATQSSEYEKITSWIHGKKYFDTYVKKELARLLRLPVRAKAQAIADLQIHMAVPADLQPIWTAIGLP